jgi:hypothetical protein
MTIDEKARFYLSSETLFTLRAFRNQLYQIFLDDQSKRMRLIKVLSCDSTLDELEHPDVLVLRQAIRDCQAILSAAERKLEEQQQ